MCNACGNTAHKDPVVAETETPRRTPSNTHLALNIALRGDPTHTTMLRLQMLQQMGARLRKLMRDMKTSIVDRDCFGIQPGVLPVALATHGATAPKAFAFERSDAKIAGFMDWLKKEQDAGILEIIQRPSGLTAGIEQPWTNTYIDSAYARGLRDGGARLRKEGVKVLDHIEQPGGVAGVMAQPFHADRLGVLYTRTFEDLKSVMDITNSKIRRELTEGLTSGLSKGLAAGKNPVTIARELYKDTATHVKKIGMVRAKAIARTEIIRAHDAATLNSYEQASLEMGEEIKVDIGLGANPCDLCIDLEAGGPYTIDQARGALPVHPNCVCTPLPVLMGNKRSAQILPSTGFGMPGQSPFGLPMVQPPVPRGTAPKLVKPKTPTAKPMPKGERLREIRTESQKKKWADDVKKHAEKYQEEFGIGPCGPTADLMVAELEKAGYNARVMFCDYSESGLATSFDTFGHYVAVELNKAGTPIRIFDPTNAYRKSKKSVTTLKKGKIPKEYAGEHEILAKGATAVQDNYMVWGQADLDWWKGKLFPKPKPKVVPKGIPKATPVPTPKPVAPRPAATPKAKAKSKPEPTKLSPKEWRASLTDEEQKAFNVWKSASYKQIRATQYMDDAEWMDWFLMSKDDLARYKSYAKTIEHATARAAPYDGSVFRGIHDLSDDAFSRFVESKTITLDTLGSASSELTVGAEFAAGGSGRGILFEIKSNKTGIDVSLLGKKTDEAEILLLRGARYKVVEVKAHKSIADTVVMVLEEII